MYLYFLCILILVNFFSDYQLILSAPRSSRRRSIWFPAKDRGLQKSGSTKRERNGYVRSFAPILCSTKRGSSVLAENYLHPIEQFRIHNPVEVPAINPKRGGIFSGNLKKKIGPSESIEKTKSIQNSKNGKNDAKSNDFIKDTPNNNTAKSTIVSAFSLKSKYEDSDFQDEQKGFVMLPSQTQDFTEIDEIEINARKILNNLGISDDMLCQAIPSGPRSDVIGAYRIVVHRLQKQVFLAKQAEALAAVEVPLKPKNQRKTCVIL